MPTRGLDNLTFKRLRENGQSFDVVELWLYFTTCLLFIPCLNEREYLQLLIEKEWQLYLTYISRTRIEHVDQ